MLLPEDAAQEGAFCRELAQVWCVESAAEDLLNVLVLFDDDDDVIVTGSIDGQASRSAAIAGANATRASTDAHKIFSIVTSAS